VRALRRKPRPDEDQTSRREQIESYQPGDDASEPLPERREPKLRDPGLRDLSKRDYVAIAKRAVKQSLDDGITDLAAGLAYYSFLAIPAVLLLALGIFSLAASPGAITRLMEELGAIVPAETTELLGSSLRRLNQNESGGLAMTAVGFVLALWTTTGAMTSFMRALNRAYDRKETRSFVRQRLVAVEMFGVMAVAFLLVFGLLVLGPVLSEWFGSLLNLEGVFGWIWWIVQWPILVVGLLAAFATLLFLGPNVDHPTWRFLTPGAVLAVAVWLAASGLFAVYTAMFGSYNKAWGTLAAVIVMLTWLWLTGLALLFGAELNAEAERSRELRAGEPAEHGIAAPPKA
jgi:membrane protein